MWPEWLIDVLHRAQGARAPGANARSRNLGYVVIADNAGGSNDWDMAGCDIRLRKIKTPLECYEVAEFHAAKDSMTFVAISTGTLRTTAVTPGVRFGGDAYSGGVATLNHRLQAGIPPG